MAIHSARTLKSNWRNRAGALPVLLLVLLYLIGSVQIESLHSLLHANEQAAIHSTDNELDPCHISVYHQQRDGGCEHKTHIKSKHTCALCNGIFHTDHFMPSPGNDGCVIVHSFVKTANESSKAKVPFITLPARAPPVV